MVSMRFLERKTRIYPPSYFHKNIYEPRPSFQPTISRFGLKWGRETER